jgi:hypothetical protein
VIGAALMLGLLSQGLPTDNTVVQLADDEFVRSALLEDLDGDGRRDLLIGSSREGTGKPSRRLQIHLSSTGRNLEGAAFAADPDHVLDVTPDVLSFAVGDVHADPGSEIVLFTSGGAFAWRPRATEEKDSFVLLARSEYLWQLPPLEDLPVWPLGVSDVDADGLDDLVLPTPDGYLVAFQRRAPVGANAGASADFSTRSFLRVAANLLERPSDLSVSGSESSAQAGLSGGRFEIGVRMKSTEGEDRGPLLAVHERLPAPQLVDWDADGDLDVWAQGNEELHVWIQATPGHFDTDPTLRLELPVKLDSTRQLDVSFSSHALQLDEDGRGDCVVFAGDKRSDDVRTQVLVYGRRADQQNEPPLFGAEGLPRQLIVLAGFAGYPDFDDVDGDGLVDLVVGSFRPDLIDQIRSASSKRLDLELYVYLNRGGVFSKRPDLTHKLSVSLEDSGLRFRFLGDITGDGVSELFVRNEPGHVRALYARKRGDDWKMFNKPVWELAVADDALLILEPGLAGQPPELLVVESAQVLHVRFRQ